MNTAAAVDTAHTQAIELNPLFVRHDLMIEMARLEMEIETAREHPSENSSQENVVSLEQRLEKVAHVLSRIPA